MKHLFKKLSFLQLIFILLCSHYSFAATFTVTNLNDSGAGSLRQAIIDANAAAGADVIEFSTSGTIVPLSALPTITEGIIIDGTTATGYIAGSPTIVIEHTLANFALNADLAGADFSFLGLSILRTAGTGSGISILNSNAITLDNCTLNTLTKGVDIQNTDTHTITNNDFIAVGTLGTGNYIVNITNGTASDVVVVADNYFDGGGNGIRIVGIPDLSIGQNVSDDIKLLDSDNIQSLGGNPFILVACHNLSIDGIVTDAGEFGFGFFHLDNCDNLSVTNCDIAYRKGIVGMNNCDGVTLSNNIFRDSWSTVVFTNGSDITVQGNEFIKCGGTGSINWTVEFNSVLAATTSPFNRVSWDNNSFDGCFNGVTLQGMHNATVSSVGTPEFKIDFEDRLFSSGAIILRIIGSNDVSMTDMDCTNRASAEVAFKRAVQVFNSSDVTLDGLTFARYKSAVSISNSPNLDITNSLFKCNSVSAIEFLNSSSLGATINGNNFDDNNLALDNLGVDIYDASNNYWGDALGSSTDNASSTGDTYAVGEFSNTTTFATTEFTGLPLLNPEIDITGSGNPITDGQTGVSATDNTIFASTAVGQTTANTFTIANTESDPLTVHSIISNIDDFEYLGGGFVLAGNSSMTVDINFSPLNTGVKNATLSVENDDCDEVQYTFVVQGEGLPACDIAITSATPTDEACVDDGEIDVVADCTACTSIEYSIDDFATMNTDGDFTGLADGTYTVKVRDSGDLTCNAEVMNVVVGATGSPDTDSDLVPDCADLDDDNDGILDEDECTSLSVNGSFEDPNIQGYSGPLANSGPSADGEWDWVTGFTAVNGWNVVSGTIDIHRDYNSASDGGQSIDLYGSSHGTIEQVFTVPAAGTAYNFSIDYSSVNTNARADVSVDGAVVTTLANTNGVTNNGEVVGLPIFTVGWNTYNYSGVSTGTTVAILFTSTVSPDNSVGMFLDNFAFNLATCDSDGDNIADSQELDSDDNGCNDVAEAGYNDPDNDGILGTSSVTVDAQGLVVGEGGYTDGVSNEDAIDPIATCPGNIEVTATSAAGAVVTFADATATDNCSVSVAQTAGLASGATFPVGENTVTFTATDDGSNTAECSFTVTVLCDLAITSVTPTDEVCPDANDGEIDVIATCTTCTSIEYSIDDFTTTNTIGDFTGLADGTYTVKVRDSGDNSCAAEMMNVTVAAGTDTELPTIICITKDTAYLDVNGMATLNAVDLDNGSTDNCGGTLTYSLSKSTFDCDDVNVQNGCGDNALDFDGIDDYVESSSPVQHGVNLTYEAWVFVQSTTGSNFQGIVTTFTPGNDNTAAVQFAVNSAGQLVGELFGDNNSGNNQRIIRTTVQTIEGGWHHLAMTFDATDMILYIDGEIQSTLAPCGNCNYYDQNPIGSLNVNRNILLGAERRKANGFYTDLIIDEVRIWNKALTEQEIQNNLVSCLSGNEADLALYYQIEEVGTNMVTDLVNQNNGVLTNMDVATDWVTGAPTLINEGLNTTLSVTDASNNTATCDVAITVIDTISPVLTCQPYTLVLDAMGNGTLTEADVVASSSDNCEIASTSLSKTSFSCADAGTTDVTIEVTDVNGNTKICVTTITVALCCDIDITSATPTDEVCPGADDGEIDVLATCTTCTSIEYSIDDFTTMNTTGDFTGLADGTYTVKMRDSGDNSCAAQMMTVMVGAGVDTTPPTAVCNDITVSLDANGLYTLTSTDLETITAGSSDDCTPVANLVVSADQPSFDCSDLGTPDGVWQNVGTPSFSAGGADNQSLAFHNGEPYVSYTDYANSFGITVMKYDGISWVNVGTAGFSSAFAYDQSLAFHNGEPFVAYRDNGNSQKTTVMKFDGTSWQNVGTPGFSAGSTSNQSLAFHNGEPFVAYKDFANGQKTTVMKYDGSTWENVGTPGFSAGGADYQSLVFHNGEPYVAYSVDDFLAPQATVMKFDGTSWINVGAPGFSAGEAYYQSLAFHNGEPYVAYQDEPNDYKTTVMKFNGTSWINVGAPGFSAGEASRQSLAFHNGEPYVAYRDDANGQKTTVMKFDGTSWINVGTAGFSAGTASDQSLAFDNGEPYVAYRDLTNSQKTTVMKFEISGTPITITDAAGNQATCNAVITVVSSEINIKGGTTDIVDGDDTPNTADNTDFGSTDTETAVDQTFTIQNTGLGTLYMTGAPLVSIAGSADYSILTQPGASDIVSGGADLTFVVRYAPADVGSDDATITITSNDCDEITYNFDINGSAILACDIAITSATPTDEVCPDADDGEIDVIATCTSCTSIEYSIDNFTTMNTIGNFTGLADGTYTVKVRDSGDNSCAAEMMNVVVGAGVDNQAPTVICQSTTVALDGNGMADLFSNITTVTMLLDDDFEVETPGVYPTSITNWNITAGDIDILSHPAPPIEGIVIDLDGTQNGTILSKNTYNLETGKKYLLSFEQANNSFNNSFDNKVELSVGSFKHVFLAPTDALLTEYKRAVLFSPDENETVSIQFEEIGTSSAGGTVLDNIIFREVTGDLSINDGSNDNCGPVILVADETCFTCSDLGTVMVTLTAYDEAGLSSSCTAAVNVEDDEAPVITCPINVTVNNDAGVCEATNVALGTPTVTDNCNMSIVATNDAPAVFPVGMTTVTWIADDGNGQSVTCTQTVTVEDNEAPVLANLPSDITISCTDALPTNTVTASDNCTDVFGSNSNILVDYSDMNWKYMNLTDTNNDCELPTGMETAGFDDSSWSIGGGGFSDDIPFQACGGFPAATQFDLDTKMVLRREVTLASGASGMHIKATYDNGFRAWVNGTPVVDCIFLGGCDYDRDRTVVVVPDNLLLTGSNTIVIMAFDEGFAAYLDATITLSSGITGLVPFSETTADGEATGDISIIERSWAVVDASGNQATHSQKITIQDTEAPTMTCNDITVDLVDENTYTLTQAQIDMIGAGTTDNCSTPTFSITMGQTDYDCADIGNSYQVTLTATDDVGNTNTCMAMITIADPNGVCCDIAITSATPTDEVCPGADDGQIDVIATCTTCTSIEYSIDDFTTMNTTGDFTGLSDGTYIVKVRDSGDNSCAAEMMNVVVGAGTDINDPTWTNAPADMTVECDGAGNTSQFNTWLADFNGTDNCGTATVTDNNTGGPTGLCTDCDGTTYNTYADFEAAAIAAGIAVGDIPTDPGYTPICGTIITNAYDLVCHSSGACFALGGTGLGQGTEAQILANFAATFPGATIASNTINGGCSGFGHGCALPAAASAVINYPEGASVTVLFTLTDENNNVINQTATFTIEDTTAPDVTGALTGVALDGCDDTVVPSAQTTVAAVEAMAGNLDVSDICAMDADLTVTSSDATTGVAPLLTVTRTYTFTDPCGNAETATQVFTVTGLDEIPNNSIDDDCDGAIDETPTATWVALPNGTSTGDNGTCVSATDCCTQTFCFGLEYNPGSNGTLTSYTTGFLTDCTDGVNSIVSNASCVMDDNSLELVDCSNGGVLMNSSGVNGSLAITVNSPVIIHQICVTVLDEETKTFMEDALTDVSMAVDLTVGPTITEYPAYDIFTVEGNMAPVLTAGTIDAIYSSNTDAEAAAIAATTGTDDCPGAVTYTAETVGTCEVVITITGTDACGLTSTVTYNTKVDGAAPVTSGSAFNYIIGCTTSDAPAAVASVTDLLAISATVMITDDCSANEDITVSHNDVVTPGCPINITRTYTLTDEAGNASTLDHFITINDQMAPTVAGSIDDVEIDACGGASAAPAAVSSVADLEAMDGNLMITDNCTMDADLVVTFTDDVSGTCPVIITRTYTVTDACNNMSFVNQTLQVNPPDAIMEDGGPVVTLATMQSVLYSTPPPALPVIVDGCGQTLTPTPAVIGGTYQEGDCKGTITYTYTYEDCVGRTFDWVYTNDIDCGDLKIRLNLEGVYDAGEMTNLMYEDHLLPGMDKNLSSSTAIIIAAPHTPFGQPYQGAPWNYTGNLGANFGEATSPAAPAIVNVYPEHVVDWVLVTVRENTKEVSGNVFKCAGWLHTNGDVTFPETCPDALVIDNANEYFLVIEHRNHLPVLDTAMIQNTNEYLEVDFTQNDSYAPVFRFGQKEIAPGVWGMYSSNIEQVNSTISINSADQTGWKLDQGKFGYRYGDVNMSGAANSADETKWKINQNITSGVKF